MKIFGYWGKAQDGWHLLPYHCLDVAACAVMLLRKNARSRETLIHLCELDGDQLEGWLGWAAALHDLGKLSPGFQWKVPDVARRLGQQESTTPTDVRHDSLGWALWHDRVINTLDFSDDQQDRVNVWMRCATGHHGLPPSRMAGGRGIRLRHYFDTKAIDAAIEWVQWANNTFRPDVSAGDIERLRRGSWWIAGIITMADWLGSSRTWFPYRPDPSPIADYWASTLTQAEIAVRESGLTYTRTRRSFADLFPRYQPSPLQSEVARLAPARPYILIVEEATGGGKTEAALAAAGGDAFFFGLPSMATANGLWSRVAALGGQQTLLHGKRWLLPAAMERAEAWINDSSRKAVLASIGVGTVDQAMLAVLMVRFGALRLAGLAGRTLIIDEVHAYDPYMTRILERLVEFHARAGGSIVLLSATMPLAVRQGFVRAWSNGSDSNGVELDSTAFPLLSYWDGVRLGQTPVPSYRQSTTRVERESEFEAVVNRIQTASGIGQCVVWIRNTVREALEAFDVLEARGLTPDLFHARFAQGDRLDIETRVVADYGKASTPKQRAGRVLIATQVVEQSLDLDFDLMITDLAPIDLVIQRAGRLHRHERGSRGEPTLVVYCPVWHETPPPTWVSDWSKGTAFVYPDHGRLWLTLGLLATGFALPGDSRRLVEGVYGQEAQTLIPAGLGDNAKKAQRRRETMAASARANLIAPGMDYSADGEPSWDDEDAPTRLGERSREWILCESGVPINGDVELSAVSLRASVIARAPECHALRVGPWRKTLNLLQGTADCERPDGARVRVQYDRRRGLTWGG